MSPTKEESFLAAAGGKFFLDTRYLLLTTPLVITTSLLTTSAGYFSQTEPPLNTLGLLSAIFLANIFALSICAIWVLVFSKTIFRNRARNPVPLFWVIIFSASVGALKGAMTGLGCWLLQIESDLGSTIVDRVGQTSLLGTWLIPAISLVAHRLSVLQAQRDSLVAERVSNTLIESGIAQTRDNQASLRAFADMAKYELSSIGRSTNGEDSANQYASAIRRLVAEQLRPLSHRIWEQENKRISSFSLSEIARQAIFSFTQARTVVAVVYAITAFPSIIKSVGISEGILRSILAGAVIQVGFWLMSEFRPKKYWVATCWFLLANLAVSFLTFVTGEIVFGYVSAFDEFQTVLAVWLWLTQLTFISAFLFGVRKGSSEIKQEFADLYGSETIDRAVRLSQARIQNRDFANYLHGQVQNKLLAVALGLEKGEATKEELEQALALVENILKTLDSGFQTLNSGDLESELAKLSNQWLGFVRITWNLDSHLKNLETRKRILLIQLIDEATSNAIRHGLAKNVFVLAKVLSDQKINLEVIDDGIGPRAGKAGLGSTFFNSVSKGNWDLVQESTGGTKLTLQF
ncbi:ATP-binding protein [Rhodoluna lacicola]|uniref:Signal transduction histidine kinase n=1 Tax=Rhodoluna lacicola TaxID=529884 RepID=A0A060JE41_9MICO|nr:ATP-binding protein [Rhodoluna lacicola]AIC48116.1 Signal transduction histidine kinase [Rhodoluna lacicola]